MKLEISQWQLHECIQLTLFISIPHQQNLVAYICPNTDCLPTSNGVWQRSTAQFKLLLFENEVNINSQTWPLIHLTSLATFYCKILRYACEKYYEYEMKWIWTKWQISVLAKMHILLTFYLILTRVPKIIVKKNLKVILSWWMLFKVAFRCMFY